MTTLNRLVLNWTGTPVVGSSVTVLHWSASDNAAPPVAAVKSALQQVSVLLPNSLAIDVPGTGDVIDDRTGNLVGVWNAAGGGTVAGGSNAVFARGVGACIGWQTGGIVQGKRGPRKLRGRTFIVPLSAADYSLNGDLVGAAMSSLEGLAVALQGAGPLAIWHRPSAAGASDGNSYGVISHRVRNKVAFLSSRRD